MSTSPQAPKGTEPPLRHVTADKYLKVAGISLTGRSLRRWCERNHFLADALGEIRTPGKCLYDTDTAPHFRRLWMEAERRYHEETARLEEEAERRFGHDEEAK